MFQHLKAIVFDWAGTTVDHGSRAPAAVFQEIFRRRGVEITADQAREPMGMAKREHIAAIVAMPAVAQAWQQTHGRPCAAADIDALYEDFLPLQQSVLAQHCDVIPGVAEAVAACRRLGLKIGSSTGYTRALMETVSNLARDQGYDPDCVICAEDAPRGRPAPYLIFAAAQRLDVYPLWNVVVVDDTPVGIEAGRNAGCWTIGITRTGNGVGLSLTELAALSPDEVQRRCAVAGQRLSEAGAHYLLESVADVVPVLEQIEGWLSRGEIPGPFRK
ncbi:MAG TPA: phosphonoacetaldehyde hydrolase [Planctomycetaceae bacterium]|nr:phosphonoacetaldehyde hydrolase [Planctomycetaceae bacterium]